MTCLGLFILQFVGWGGRCSELFLRSMELFLNIFKVLGTICQLFGTIAKMLATMFCKYADKTYAVYFHLNADVSPFLQNNCPVYTKILLLFR